MNGRHVRDKRLKELLHVFHFHHIIVETTLFLHGKTPLDSRAPTSARVSLPTFSLNLPWLVQADRVKVGNFILLLAAFQCTVFFLLFTRANQQRVLYERSESVWRLYFVCRKISKWKTVASGYENSKKKYRGKGCGRVGPHTRQEQPVATGGYTLHHILQYS